MLLTGDQCKSTRPELGGCFRAKVRPEVSLTPWALRAGLGGHRRCTAGPFVLGPGAGFGRFFQKSRLREEGKGNKRIYDSATDFSLTLLLVHSWVNGPGTHS